MEVLSTFEVNHTYARLRHPGGISFQIHGEPKSISYREFVNHLSIYDHEFLHGMHYTGLPLDFPTHVEPRYVWRTITQETGQDSRKPYLLINLAHHYIHALMSRSLMVRVNNTRVVSRMDLLIMYNMIHRYPLNLAHVVAKCIAHQNQHPPLGSYLQDLTSHA